MFLLWNLEQIYKTPVMKQLFRPVKTKGEEIVALSSKIAVESLLVSLEMNTYYLFANMITAKTGSLYSMICLTSGIGYGRMILPFVVTFYRIYKAKKLDILRFPKTKSDCGIPIYFG